LFKILYYFDGKVIVRKGFAVLVNSDFQAIVTVSIFDILQPLLTDTMQEHEGGSTDGMAIVHVLLA